MSQLRSRAVVESALALSDAGVKDAENAAQHEIAVKTLRRWRRDYQRRGRSRVSDLTASCPCCDEGPLDEPAYAELFGWYLGDGHLVLARRAVYSLQVYNDARYPHDIARIQQLMRAVKPDARPHTRHKSGCVAITSGWKHWPCLFPQHGPGRKHERSLVLMIWQQQIVRKHPGPFLRGLLHSDGCRVRNWARRNVAGVPKRYDYPRWQFVNASADIRGFLCDALDLVEVPWRHSSTRTISVSTRAGVARLDDLVGQKS